MDVKRVAKLANLPLTDEEEKKIGPQLEASIDLINKINELETQGIEPTAQVTSQSNIVREDEIDKSRLLVYNRYFVVPAIFNE